MADFLGDFAAGASVVLWWNTNAIAGESITRATDGSIRIYKGSSDTQRSSSAGITDTEDADGVTGVHRLSIDLSDNTDAGFYAAGSDYAVVLVGADIDGKTVNHALGQFSIENRAMNTAAAVRAALGMSSANLDTQLADLPTNAELATALASADDAVLAAVATVDSNVDSILVDTVDIQSRLPAALVSGRMDSSVGAMAANTLTASALATDAVTEIQSGLATAAALTTVDSVVDDILLDTAVIGAAGAGLTAIPYNAAWDAEIQSEVTDALNAYDPPTNAELTTALAAADDAVLARLGTPAGASIAADIAAIETQTDDIGANGAGLTAVPWNAAWDAEVESEVADALNAYDPPTNAEMEARTLVAASYATAAALATVDSVADAIQVTTDKLDDTLELDSTVYRFTTNALEQAPAGGGGGGDPLTNAVPGTYEAGTAGYVLGQIPTIKSQTDLITANNVSYTAPVNPNTQSLALNQSQDYLAADGGQLPEWSSTAWTPFSLSTAASVTWYIRDFDGTLRSGAVNVVSDTELDVRTFANAVTALLTPGDDPKRKVQVWAVLDVAHGSAHKKLVDAKLTVSDDVRN